MDASLTTAIAAVLVAAVSGVIGLVNSSRANRPAESEAQLAWVKQAQDEVRSARQDARDVRVELAAARRQAARLQREFSAMQDWVDRVLRARDAYLETHDQAAVADTGVLRILHAIDGGPNLGRAVADE